MDGGAAEARAPVEYVRYAVVSSGFNLAAGEVRG
jgi:hypothetical protein